MDMLDFLNTSIDVLKKTSIDILKNNHKQRYEKHRLS